MTVDVHPGASFGSSRVLTREEILDYAHVSQDFNPLHVDRAFANQAGFRDVMAHGMLTVAIVDDLLAETFGAAWLATGHLTVGFKSPAYAGDELAIRCDVRSVIASKKGELVTCRIRVTRSTGESVIDGVAALTI